MARAQETDGHHALLWGKSPRDIEHKASQSAHLCWQLVAKKVSGVFFAPLELTPGKGSVNQKIVETFRDAGIPVVLLDRDIVAYPTRSGYDLVEIDNRRAGYAITSHLLDVGCTRIAFVARPGSAPTVDARMAGYREAMLNTHTDCTPDFVCRIDPLGKDVDRLKPDGIICANDFTAVNLMKTLSELKITVPQQIRLCGIDDVKYASLLAVLLTTVHQPCEKMGAQAVAAMDQRIRNPDIPARDILLDFHLAVRESSGLQR